MTRRLAGPAVVVAGSTVLVLLLGLALGWWPNRDRAALPGRPLTATTTFSTRAVSFGDRLGARIDVLVDPTRIDPANILVEPRFSPYKVVSRSRETRRSGGVLVSFRYQLECLEATCLPTAPRVTQTFQPARVVYRTQAGARATLTAAWPPVQLSSRVTAAERLSPTRAFRYSQVPPPVTYAVAPGTLRALLTALAAALGLAAAVLAWLALGRRRGPTVARDDLPGLQRALRAVRLSTANGQPVGRRKALGWLGRELRAVERPELARDAGRLAWSEAAPTPESAGAFADRVEGEDQP